MRDDKYGRVGMLICNATQRAEDSAVELVAGFPVSEHAVRDLLGEALVDLLVGEAFPATEVPLAELWERGYVQPASLGGDLRGLLGPGEVARVDGLELFIGELSDQAASLLTAGLVERAVGVALQAPAQIPIRLAVAHEEDPRHA